MQAKDGFDKGAPNEEAVAAVFRALGHPARCKIVDLLRESPELRVGDIAQVFDMSLNGVSKHLKILEKAGLISRRKKGTTHYISMRWEGLRPADSWLDARRHFWNKRLDLFEKQLEKD